MRLREQLPKVMLLVAIVAAYVIIGALLFKLVDAGVLKRAPYQVQVYDNSTDNDAGFVYVPPSQSLQAAIRYLDTYLRHPDGHIDLYRKLHRNQEIPQFNNTNSEAVSYYLQIMAQEGDKKRFDEQLDFMQEHMMHPEAHYLMWRLDDQDRALGEGRNMAPDADLRALRALYIAKDKWGDPRYDAVIANLTAGLEAVAINDQDVLVAYGGGSGDGVWRAKESYLAYSDFQVLDRLANTRGGVWVNVSREMRNITLGAQIWNGLYNTEYWGEGKYGNNIDGGVYSINSLWVMVRFAESGDPQLMESARKSLKFYQDEYAKEGKIYVAYKSDGTPANTAESAWNYALVARAAKALHEDAFAQIMERRMLDFQDLAENSTTYGAIVEGAQNDERVGQFTMQESILTMQELQGKSPRFNE